MTKRRIQAILGSTRDQRRGPPIAQAFAAIAAARDPHHERTARSLRVWPRFLSGATPAMNPDSREEAAWGWTVKVADGDGYVLVVPLQEAQRLLVGGGAPL